MTRPKEQLVSVTERTAGYWDVGEVGLRTELSRSAARDRLNFTWESGGMVGQSDLEPMIMPTSGCIVLFLCMEVTAAGGTRFTRRRESPTF